MGERKKEQEKKKRKVAWGITGSGEKMPETIDTMKRIKLEFDNRVNISVFVSKAGDLVLRYYNLGDYLKENFDKVLVEINSNSPFLAGQMQSGKFEFLLIAPTTSNTVAKIATGITDSMLSNAAIMSLKANVPVYVMPSDYKEGTMITKLPSGKDLELRVRKEDADNVRKLADMSCMHVLEKPEDIQEVFRNHFGKA